MDKNINLEEIRKLSEKILHNKNGVGLEAKYIENEYEKRIETYNKMLAKVESNLIENEEIITGKINVPHSGGSAGRSVVLYYQGLFFTNKRIFIFDMNFKYEEIEEMKVEALKDIASVKEVIDFDIIKITFKDSYELSMKSYYGYEKTLVVFITEYINK